MSVQVKASRARVDVGPPDGPTLSIPTRFTIEVTDTPPYDLTFVTEWDDDEGRHVVRSASFVGNDDAVRMSSIIRVPIAETVSAAIESYVLDERGWSGIVADHPDESGEAVDALVYLASVAVGSPKPSANVALARGLSPASGPKRVGMARKLGLIPEAESGKPSAGLGAFDRAARRRTG
ncbi:MAG: hypothetical protein KDB37_20300 [Ilumatobacter sp.]|nr:hypothetical protein [Ilumatobacter sp.]